MILILIPVDKANDNVYNNKVYSNKILTPTIYVLILSLMKRKMKD